MEDISNLFDPKYISPIQEAAKNIWHLLAYDPRTNAILEWIVLDALHHLPADLCDA